MIYVEDDSEIEYLDAHVVEEDEEGEYVRELRKRNLATRVLRLGRCDYQEEGKM
jgi:hypothetical protein